MKALSIFFFFTFFFLLALSPAHAQEQQQKPNFLKTLGLQAEAGREYGNLYGTFEGSKIDPKNSFYFSFWALSLGAEQTRTGDIVTGRTISNQSRESYISLGVSSKAEWDLLIVRENTDSKETDFSQIENALQLSHHFLSESGDQFAVLDLLYGKSTIRQTFFFDIPGSPSEEKAELDQQKFSAALAFRANPQLNLRFSGTGYTYSKSKDELQAAYSSTYVNDNVSEFVATISDLPEHEFEVGMSYTFLPQRELIFNFENKHLIVDDSDSKTLEILVSRSFSDWQLTGGPVLNRSASSLTYWTLLADLQFFF